MGSDISVWKELWQEKPRSPGAAGKVMEQIPGTPEGANNQKVMTLLGTRCPMLWEKLLYVR